MLFTGKKIWIYLARLNPEFDHNLDPDKIEIGFFYWNLESSIFSRFWILDPDKNWKKNSGSSISRLVWILDPAFPELSGFWNPVPFPDSGYWIQYSGNQSLSGSSKGLFSRLLDPEFPEYQILRLEKNPVQKFWIPESRIWFLLDFTGFSYSSHLFSNANKRDRFNLILKRFVS